MNWTCRSGRHHWQDATDAGRCCDPQWRRVTWFREQDPPPDLDPDGLSVSVINGEILLRGWVRAAEVTV